MNNLKIDENNIIFDKDSLSQKDAFRKISKLAFQLGYVFSEEEFYRDLISRESVSTTGFKEGIAIPHGKSTNVKKAGVFLIKYDHPIEWNSLDDKPIEVAIALSIPEEGSREHLKTLSKIARKLMDKTFVEELKSASEKDELVNLINKIN